MSCLIKLLIAIVFFSSCKEPKVSENSNFQSSDRSSFVNAYKKKHKLLRLFKVRDDKGYVLDKGYFLNESRRLPGGYYLKFDKSMELKELNHELFLVNKCSLDSNQVLIIIDFPHRDVDSIKFGLAKDIRNCKIINLGMKAWCAPRLFIKVKDPLEFKDIFIKFRIRLKKESVRHRKNLLDLPFHIDYSTVDTFCLIESTPVDSLSPCDLVDIEIFEEASFGQVIQIQ